MIGMMWFDDNPNRNLAQKVERALRYYWDKHGGEPGKIVVNPAMLDNTQGAIAYPLETHQAVMINNVYLVHIEGKE